MFKFLPLVFILVISNVFAESKQVIVTGKAIVTDGTTLRQARNQALNQARSLAVETAAGVTVNTSTLVQNSLIVSELVKTFSQGFLIREEILDWQGKWIKTNDKDDLGLPVVTVKLKGLVEIPQKSYFRNFVIDVKLNKQTYRSGESAELVIESKDDIYLIIANYTSDNKIVPIFPFNKEISNRLSQFKTLTLPGNYSKKFDIIINAYPGQKQDSEAFIIIGIPAVAKMNNMVWSELFQPGIPTSYVHFFETILELRSPWIAEKTIVYTVLE